VLSKKGTGATENVNTASATTCDTLLKARQERLENWRALQELVEII
jgi:hypothetical protein